MTDEQQNKLESLMDAVALGRRKRTFFEQELQRIEMEKSHNSAALQAAERAFANFQNDLLREKVGL